MYKEKERFIRFNRWCGYREGEGWRQGGRKGGGMGRDRWNGEEGGMKGEKG